MPRPRDPFVPSPDRLAAVQPVVQLLGPELGFEVIDRRGQPVLHLASPGGTLPVRLTRSGATLAPTTVPLGLGGTREQALAQLYRFLRQWPRSPRSWWSYRVADRHPDVLLALDAAGYFEPLAATACVRCGRPDPGCDWWHGPTLCGPCCTFGHCRPQCLSLNPVAELSAHETCR